MAPGRTLVLFFAIAYTWAWLIFVPMVMFHLPLPWIAVATFGPTVAALVTHRVTAGSYRAFRVYSTWRRTLGATALGVALMVLAYGWTSSPLWIYVLFVTGQSVILSYATNLARFAVITPIVMHATFNTVSRFLGGLFAKTQPSAPIPFELVMAAWGIATALILVFLTRGRLGYEQSGAGAESVRIG